MDHRSSRIDRAEWKCALRPLLPARTPSADVVAYAAKARKFFDGVAGLPLSPAFPLEAPSEAVGFDVADMKATAPRRPTEPKALRKALDALRA